MPLATTYRYIPQRCRSFYKWIANLLTVRLYLNLFLSGPLTVLIRVRQPNPHCTNSIAGPSFSVTPTRDHLSKNKGIMEYENNSRTRRPSPQPAAS